MAVTIAISNQKGGVGKTTTCLSLGASLAEEDQFVLLIDLDPQAHLTLSLGLDPEKLRYTVGDALSRGISPVSVSHESKTPGMDIVPANQSLTAFNKTLYQLEGYEFRLRDSIDAMRDGVYDVILIDCPPSFNALTLNALTAADLLIVPVQCEYYAVQALRQTVKLVEAVRERTNPHLIYRVLMTMYDRRNRICQLIRNQMESTLSDTLFQTVIEIDTKLRESVTMGKPITLYAPHTRGALQYRALAKELINHG